MGGLRSIVWRLGRFLYRWARREGRNHPSANGELWLLDFVVRASEREPLVLVDVGANKGDWSAEALRALGGHGRCGAIHAVEPARFTFEHLRRRFEDHGSVTPHNVALSNRSGEADFYVIGATSGRNSLHPSEDARVERVPVRTLDALVVEYQIAHIAMVKCDAEGHDLSVLEGARESLQAGRIDAWQFEYNHRWLANKASLFAVFQFLEGLPYSLGKLYRNGIERYDRWHFELDRFIESNYVLIRHGTLLEQVARTVRFDASNVPE